MVYYQSILSDPLVAKPLPAEMKRFRIPFLVGSFFENSTCQLLRQTWVNDSEDFYIQFTYINILSACSLVAAPARDHIVASLIYILEGNLYVREKASSKQLPRMKGDFYLRHLEIKNSSFILDFAQPGICQIIYISLSKKKLLALRSSEPIFNNKNIINAREIRKAGAWLKARIVEMQQRREPNKDALDRYLIRRAQRLFDAFIHLYDSSSINWRSIKPNERMENLQIFIQNNLGANLTLRTLSKMLYINKDVLRKTFQQVIGISISKYIQRARIKKACQLLDVSNGKTIEQIAAEVGYKSLDGFYYAFETQIGSTPNAYLKRKN